MANSKKYWKGLEQLDNDPQFLKSSENEFAENLPVVDFLADEDNLKDASTSRRDFLKFLGFSVTAASLAACETPVTKAIPYLNKPEEIIPGVANYYASTYYDGNDYAPILVKTREGRPIFISGNKEASITKGAVNARVNASVISLYDNNRLKQPLIDGANASWASVDNRLGKALEGIKAKGGTVKVLSNSIISPSTQNAINAFLGNFNASETTENHVVLDAISYGGTLEANSLSFNKRAIPTYNFSNAKTIVSVGADFMGNWLDSLQYDYTSRRNPDGAWMSKHYQFEANMSLTGTNADVRVPVKPSEYGTVLTAIYNKLTGGTATKTAYDKQIDAAVASLSASKGESIVVCGQNDVNIQLLVNAINNALGNYGKTIDIKRHSNTRQGNDEAVASLMKEMEAGKVDALLIYGVDPVFVLGDAFKKALKKVKLSVSFASKVDESSVLCNYVCPDHHGLESWNDANPVAGYYSLGQPTIAPLFDTRQAQESFLTWTGNKTGFHDYIKQYWEATIFPKQSARLLFTDFWNQSLHDGFATVNSIDTTVNPFSADVASAIQAIKKTKGSALEIELTQNGGIGAGVGADNPILQELPDPVTKITWDNYVTMNPSEMKERGYGTKLGQREAVNVVNVTVNGKTVEQVPVVAQPGQARGTIGLAVGYGKRVGNMETPTGKNAYPLVAQVNGTASYHNAVTIEDVQLDEPYYMAATQTHQTVMGRDSVIKETTLGVYKKGDKNAYNAPHTLVVHEKGENVKKLTKEFNLWGKDQPVENIGHRWGMSIDMNLCTGCGGCITACNIENNVPVVGKDEVRRGREMHWLRIDRYYSSEDQEVGDVGGTLDNTIKNTGKGVIGSYTEMENPADNPQVVHQPMMCQHCNHAGCETVCPVAATTHSNEGLNMMTYNRCIGTRYCANNCAYKVRRFNWFNYMAYDKFADFNPSQDDLGRMVLNPDVVVRSRGVMEKCSFCVQNIQAAKLEAKKAGKPIQDGDVQTACSSACSAGAIKFGDLNDTGSAVNKGMNSDRAYRVIEEVGQEPNIYYQTKVRNVEA